MEMGSAVGPLCWELPVEEALDDPATRPVPVILDGAGARPLPARPGRLVAAAAAIALLAGAVSAHLLGSVLAAPRPPARAPAPKATPAPGATPIGAISPGRDSAGLGKAVVCRYTGTDTPLAHGATGDAVRQAQCELDLTLSPADHPQLRITGRFGPLTEHAVRAFQRCTNAAPDGVLGAQTWAALNRWAAISTYVC